MSLRPIDMHIAVQRSADVIQASNNAARRPEILHQQFAARIQREVEHNDKHVRQSNKSEEEAINREGRGDSRRGSKKDDKDKKKAALRAFNGGSTIDIKV